MDGLKLAVIRLAVGAIAAAALDMLLPSEDGKDACEAAKRLINAALFLSVLSAAL